MDNSQHTPGPWRYWSGSTSIWGGGDPGRAICIVTGARKRADEARDANALLIAAAPAMELALEMIACGVARIERCGSLTEFCFDGLRYSHNGDWGAMLNVVGWGKARTSLAAATGSTHE